MKFGLFSMVQGYLHAMTLVQREKEAWSGKGDIVGKDGNSHLRAPLTVERRRMIQVLKVPRYQVHYREYPSPFPDTCVEYTISQIQEGTSYSLRMGITLFAFLLRKICCNPFHFRIRISDYRRRLPVRLRKCLETASVSVFHFLFLLPVWGNVCNRHRPHVSLLHSCQQSAPRAYHNTIMTIMSRRGVDNQM